MHIILPSLITNIQIRSGKTFCFLLLLTIFSSIISSEELPEKQSSFLTATDILDAWEANYGSIHSMKVKYTEDISIPDPNGNDTILNCIVERVQDGLKFYTKYSNSNPDFPITESDIEAAFDGNVSTFCDHKISFGRIDNGISTSGYSNDNSVERYMWLTRYYFDPDYPDGETYFSYWIKDYLAGSLKNTEIKIKVRDELDNILGELCHIIEISRGTNGRRFWLAHGKGMCPMKFESFNGQNVNNRMEALKIAKVMTDIGEIWYPIEMEQANENPKTGKMQIFKCQIHEFIPHLADIAPDTFSVKFPNGTTIMDNVLGIEYKKGEVVESLDNLNIEINSPTQISSLESNQIQDTFNNSLRNILSDERKGTLNIDNQKQDSSNILGDILLHSLHKYIYALIAIIIFTSILLYNHYKFINKK